MAEKKITNAGETPAAEKKIKKAADTAAEKAKTTQKKIIKAESTPEETAAKPAAKKKIKNADGTETTVKPAEPVEGNATGLRIDAIALWVVAIVFEVLAVLTIFGKIGFTFMPTLAQIIIELVLDLACVCGGSILWKKANRIDPASEKNKVKFWLWNNMGVIVTAVAFIPFIILALTNKNADKKTKAIATVVAVIALLIGGLVSYDWNPVSAEGKETAIETLEDAEVYWSPFGKVYHMTFECSHLNHSDELTKGTVKQAIEANRTRLCKDCADKFDIEIGENGEIKKSAAGTDAEYTDEIVDIPVADEGEEVEFNIAE